MLNGNELARYFSEIEDERYYSENEIEDLYEKAFSDGYYYAQREFGTKEFFDLVKKYGKQAADKAKDVASQGKSKVEELASRAKDAASKVKGSPAAASTAGETAPGLFGRAKNLIVNNPKATAGIAAGTLALGLGGRHLYKKRKERKQAQENGYYEDYE